MKLWKGYGSEHSMNLVMIGHFKEPNDAEEAKRLIEKIANQVGTDEEGHHRATGPRDRFSDAMLNLLIAVNLYTLRPEELEQFLYDVRVGVEDNKIVITTDEVDVSVFMKVLLERGARVEVYSAHDYPNTRYGR